MSIKDCISIEYWEDEGTKEIFERRWFHIQTATLAEQKREIPRILFEASPEGQILQLRSYAETLSLSFPEREAALRHLVRAADTSDELYKCIEIKDARAQLNHAKFRAEKVRQNTARSNGGKAAAKTKRIDNAERNLRIQDAAKKMLKDGEKRGYVYARLAERFTLSPKQISRIVGNTNDTI